MKWDVLDRRAVRWYLGVTLTLTAVGGLLTWLVVPPTGLVRSVYADVGFAGEPLSQARTPEINLAFLDEDPTLLRRFFSVEWRGFWFLPRTQTVDLYVSVRTTASRSSWTVSSCTGATPAWGCTRPVRRSRWAPARMRSPFAMHKTGAACISTCNAP